MADLPLLEHQKGDIDWIHEVGRGLLGNEPGLGKSRSAIEAFDGGRNLIIAPSLVVAGGTWDDELSKWAKDPSRWTIATYSMLNERERTGKGSGTRPVKKLRPGLRERWDALVVDEAHYIKGRETSWTWATEQISRTSGSVLLMTGTPMPNWAHELWTLLRVLSPEEARPGRDFGSFWRWAEQWFDTSPNRFSNGNPVVGEMLNCNASCKIRPPSDPCVHFQRFAEVNLGHRFRRMLRDDCLDLPPITETTIHTPLSGPARTAYNKLKKEFFAEYDGDEILAWSQGALNSLLDKMTTSPYIVTGEGEAKGGKLDQLRFDLENRTRPTLVLAHYRASVEACARVAENLGARVGRVHGGIPRERQGEAVRDFQQGRSDVLCGSLETLAEGLTLTQADMAIFVESSYKPSRNEQAKYRIHRMGQTRPCTVLKYITPKSVDENKHKLLATKTDQQMRVLTAAQFRDLL